MNRLEAMATLVAAVDAGSFSAASRALGAPLATVSRRVSDLEAHLGTKLLVRTSRRLEQTDAGRAYIAACREILETVDAAERAASGEYAAPKGEMTIAAPIVFGRLHVLPILIAFLEAYPEINARLALSDRVADLVEDHVDVALRIGRLPDSGLVATRIGEVRRIVCASPGYLARKGGAPERPEDLTRYECVTFDAFAAPSRWRFHGPKGEIAVDVTSRLTVNTAEAAIDAAEAGLGLTRVISYQVASALRAGRLTTVLSAFEPESWPVNLVYSGQGRLPLKTRAFIDFSAERLRRVLRSSGA